MSNKFSQQINKSKGHKSRIDITDLLDDSCTESLISRAKESGRYLCLPVNCFVPDPNQPRKTFDKEALDELLVSIENNGQLQPILVGDCLPNGKYPIITGERRWRAIAESEKVSEVQAIIRSGDVDELHLLLMQIDENNKREQIPAIENAMAMRRVINICKAEGNGQAYAAKLLGISPAQLSKHLVLLGAPESVAGLSLHGETQDVEVLYNLAKASESKPEEVEELIDLWRSGELNSNLRKASKELSSEAKKARNDKKSQEVKGTEFGEKCDDGSNPDEVPVRLKKASAVHLSLDDNEFILKIEIGNKRLSYRVEADVVISLKGEIDKNWS